MSLWFLPVATLPDEDVTFEAAANLWQGRRAVGGKVTVTSRRLLFTPNRVDAATGGRGLAVDLAEIGGVEVVRGGRPRLWLSMWRQLVSVALADGERLILVREPEQLAAAMANHRS